MSEELNLPFDKAYVDVPTPGNFHLERPTPEQSIKIPLGEGKDNFKGDKEHE